MVVDRLLSLVEVSRRLRVPIATAREWAATGKLPAPVQLPNGRRRWRACELQAWLAGLPRSEREKQSTKPEVAWETLLPLAQEILQAAIEADEWETSPALAMRISEAVDSRSGTWARAMAQLKELGLITTNQKLGVSATIAGRKFAELRQHRGSTAAAP